MTDIRILEERAVEEEIKQRLEERDKPRNNQVPKKFLERYGHMYYHSVIRAKLGRYIYD